MSLNNKLHILQELREIEVETTDSKWKKIKAVTSVGKEVLSPKKYQHKEWITAETLCKIRKKKDKKATVNNSSARNERTRAQEAYTEVNKAVKNNIRANKRSCIMGLPREVDEAAT